MANSVPEFWQLVEESRLLFGDQCRQLDQEFHATNGATDHASPHALAEWLVSRNIFSRYQVTVLLAGRPGPFVYGDYKIYDRVESGRLANEFRAVHAAAGHPVLLRFLTGPVVQDAALWAAAATEAHVACSLNHPNLQRFFELVDLGSFKFLVEEDLHGETLSDRLAAGRLPPHEACRIARQIALGLAALHVTGRAHGDVRPVNVWLESPTPPHPAEVKLLRDPLVPPAPPNFSAPDPHGWLLAQSDYLAPEFHPGKTPDVLTDLYALGCTLYHMLAGQPPFPGGSATQKMDRHRSEAIRPLESYGVPQKLAELVTYLMAKNFALRRQDAQTVADQLVAFIDPATAHTRPPPALPTLPAFESALRQSHARLATQVVQGTFGLASSSPTATEQVTAASIIRTSEVAAVGSVPKGKVVTAPAAEKSVETPAFVPREPDKRSKLIEPKVNDPALLAATEARERKKLILVLTGVGVAAIALIIGLNAMRGGKDQAGDPSTPVEEVDVPELETNIGVVSKPGGFQPETSKPGTGKSGSSDPPETGPTYEVVADDGKLPWASPTSGVPIDLKYVPPLAGVSIVVRPAALLASDEGPKVLQALGPKFASAREAWEQAAGLKLEDCRQMIVSLHDNDNAYPKVSVVARLPEALDAEAMAAKWGAKPQKSDGQEFYSSAAWSYYLPTEENGKVVVMASADDIQEIIAQPLPPRKRELEQVRRNTDADRHVTVLFDPTFLFSGAGDPLFSGDFARIKEPLKWLLGEGLQVGALSVHFGETLYTELRVQTKVDKPPHELADDFRKRIEQIPDDFEKYVVLTLDAPPYWGLLASRLPGMIRQLHEQTRIDAEGNQAIINVVLPGPAAHNLVLGTELAIATAPGATSTAAATAPAAPKTVKEVLKLKLKEYSFDQTDFEGAIKDVEKEARGLIKGAEVEFSIVILGDDLMAGGITRNKSLANFKMTDKTVAEVLTGLCLANNNIPGVKSPSEENQKLVWAVAEEAGVKKVFITTRAGAATREFKLPEVFVGQ